MTTTLARQQRYLAQTPESTPVAVTVGRSTAAPAATGEQLASGPLVLQVDDVNFGAEATELLLDASIRNQAPPEGMIHVVASISLENAGDRAISVDDDDFGFVTEAGRVWRSLQIEPPDPALGAQIEPGQAMEGWVAGQLEDDAAAQLMIFNCRDLGGVWSERFIALTDGSAIDLPVDLIDLPNNAGMSPSAPASLGEVVVTDDWAIAVTEVRFADDVVGLFPPEDYRTTALASAAPDVVPYWIAFHIELQQVRTDSAILHFPVDALNLAGEDGEAVEDVRILSSPLPELSGDYLPGGRGAGWYAIELPIDHTGTMLRFQPWRAGQDVRFIAWGEQIATPTP